MKRIGTYLFLIALAALVSGTVGCSKKATSDQMSSPVEEPTRTVTPPREETSPPPAELPPTVALEDVYFDFDRFNIRTDARNVLSRNAKQLSDAGGVRIMIEGHCDERGTRAYNMALGDKRARAAKDFLVRYGIDAGRIDIVSYGEDRPFARGSNESAWQLNRRAHFVVRD